MRIDVATLFPEICEAFMAQSIIGRAQKNGRIEFHAHQIREHTLNKQRQVDDYPYGGGPGMVMQAQPIYDCCAAVLQAVAAEGRARPHVVFMTAGGTPLTQQVCKRLAKEESLLLVCGHYEGIDERVIEALADEEISIGDYVLTGGELAAAVISDAIVRLIPGSISDEQSALSDCYQDDLLAAPIYTRPADYKGWKVPDILLSGNEAKIRQWEFDQAVDRTRRLRPDLLKKTDVEKADGTRHHSPKEQE